MKTLLSLSNITRSLALCIAISATFSVKAQTPIKRINIGTIPQNILLQMNVIDTRLIDLPAQTVAAPTGSRISGQFKVPADGKITLKLKLDHQGNSPVNHTVKIEMLNPNGLVAAKIEEFIVKHNEIRTATLMANASEALSGCSGLNMWSYRVINNDNVNKQATKVDGTVVVPDATGNRVTYPNTAFTLNQGSGEEYVFRTPKGHNGKIKITVTYAGGPNVEVRLFKAGVEPAPNEANAVATKLLTQSGSRVFYAVSANAVTSNDQFWTVRLRNKSVQTVSNLKAVVSFTDCSEGEGESEE